MGYFFRPSFLYYFLYFINLDICIINVGTNASPYIVNSSLIVKGTTWKIVWNTGNISIAFNRTNPITKAIIENLFENTPSPNTDAPPIQYRILS